MTSELRPAVDVWEDACRAWDDAPINPDRIGKVNGEGYSFVDEDRAAAAVIEADREAVRAEQAAELAKFKALDETLAGALEKIATSKYDGLEVHRVSARQCHRIAAEALHQYKEATNV